MGTRKRIVVSIKKAWFEAQRKPEGPGDILQQRKPVPAREFMQISPSRFYIPGLQAAKREQIVRDPEAIRVLNTIATNTHDSVARFV
jgi:hypothetical protein